jgi:hypothetical protein
MADWGSMASTDQTNGKIWRRPPLSSPRDEIVKLAHGMCGYDSFI